MKVNNAIGWSIIARTSSAKMEEFVSNDFSITHANVFMDFEENCVKSAKMLTPSDSIRLKVIISSLIGLFSIRWIDLGLGYIAILMLSLIAIFTITMDILKSFFHIDPVKTERRILRQRQAMKKKMTQRPQPRKIVRFQYIAWMSKTPFPFRLVPCDLNCFQYCVEVDWMTRMLD